MVESILKIWTVSERTSISRSQIYLMMSKGEFPKPIKLSERSVGWTSSSIDKWIEEQIQKSAV